MKQEAYLWDVISIKKVLDSKRRPYYRAYATVYMEMTEASSVSSWKNGNGDVVEIPDSLDDLSDHIRSVMKASEIADVSTEFNGMANEDVTLHIDSETDGQIRNVVFKLEIRDWSEHTGGKSAYSEMDMVTYTVDMGDEEPSKYMHEMGAFFHKLDNKFSSLFDNTTYNKPMFKLKEHDESSVVFVGSVSLHRYDYV